MASLPAVPAVLPQVSYASLGRRIAGYLIDLLIAFSITMASGLFMRSLRALGFWTVPPEGTQDPVALWHGYPFAAKFAVIMAFVISMGPIYTGLFQASAWQASIGKRLLKIYVTDYAGKRLSLLRSLGRSFAQDLFNVFPYVGFISLVTIMAASRKQALHDFAAKTIVVNGRPAGSGSIELWRIVVAFGSQFLWFALTMVAVLGRSS